MTYWDAKDLPFYDGLAKTFPLADRWSPQRRRRLQ
jgi:hypothetical protein